MGIRKELLSTEPSKDIICGRCKDVLNDPKSLQCGHYFCSECVDGRATNTPSSPLSSASTCRTRKSARRLHKCPHCDAQVKDIEKTTENPTVPAWISVKLASLSFAKCPQGCGLEDLRVSDFLVHQLRACPNANQPCPNLELGCKEKVTRRSVENHLENCLFRKVKCPVCALETTQAELFPHQIKRRCAERATKLEVTRAVRRCHQELTDHNKDLLETKNASLQTHRNVVMDHLCNRGIKGYVKPDENTTPFGTPRNPRFYENLPTCQRCHKFFQDQCNHMTSCCWHAGVSSDRYLIF